MQLQRKALRESEPDPVSAPATPFPARPAADSVHQIRGDRPDRDHVVREIPCFRMFQARVEILQIVGARALYERCQSRGLRKLCPALILKKIIAMVPVVEHISRPGGVAARSSSRRFESRCPRCWRGSQPTAFALDKC